MSTSTSVKLQTVVSQPFLCRNISYVYTGEIKITKYMLTT